LKALGLGKIKPKDVQQLDSVEHVGELQKIGKAVGEKKVKRDHFS
jgi:hypothetical protein